jgi:hypothetical protein
MDYTSVSVDIREYLKSKFGGGVEKLNEHVFTLMPDKWRRVPTSAPDNWAVGEVREDEEQPWSWWVPCSLTGQWRSRTESQTKQNSQSAKDILSFVTVRHNKRIFRTFIGVVYDSNLYEINYPKRQETAAGRSNTKKDKFRDLVLKYTHNFVFVQPALSCHALCIDRGYTRDGECITVEIFPAAGFNMKIPAGAVVHSVREADRKEGVFALSRYACVSSPPKGFELKLLFARSRSETFDKDTIYPLIRKVFTETLQTMQFDIKDTNNYKVSLEELPPEVSNVKSKHVSCLFKSHNKTTTRLLVWGVKLHFEYDDHKSFSNAENTAFGNLILHFIRVAVENHFKSDEIGCVVAPIDDEATFEICTTVATMPGMKDLSKGLPDQTYTQRVLTVPDPKDTDKPKATETIKRQTMDLYGHTRVDIERFQVLGSVLLARDYENRSGFRSLHPELENVKDILGIQRFSPNILHTTQAITVAPMSQEAYKTNAFAAMYGRGLLFSKNKSVSNPLYPLSVYTPNFESVHSLLSSEMARIVSHRMRKLRMTDSDADFAHSWMYNAVRGQVWSPSGPWSSGRFHPRIVSALTSRRENLIDYFYYARMVLPSGAMSLPNRFNFDPKEAQSAYGHLAFIRELAREALQLYSTCGTVVQPLINQMCLGQLYRRIEGKGDPGERAEMALKVLLFEPFAFLDDVKSLRVGNMNLFEIAKAYSGVIQP